MISREGCVIRRGTTGGEGDSTIFFVKNRVDITVWKTLWKL